jgi:type IV pilus assembly protein PilB
LVDMGVKPYAIATSVSLIIAQRLARKLCSNCKQPIDVPAEALKKEGFEAADIENGIRVYRAVGCGQCTDGYKGRMGIYQVMPVTETIGRIIMDGGGAMDINDQATKAGIWNLRRSGLQKVKDGVTRYQQPQARKRPSSYGRVRTSAATKYAANPLPRTKRRCGPICDAKA